MTAVEPTTPTNTPTTATRSRRDVLCGLMVALVAPGALVAACSDGDSSAGGDPTNGGGTTPAGGGAGQKLAALADVPDGGGLIVEGPDGKVLLARTGEEVKAYNAACTHMGTLLGTPKNGVTTCPNHGSQFDTATGAVKPGNGPATKPLIAVEVKVEGDQVVLA